MTKPQDERKMEDCTDETKGWAEVVDGMRELLGRPYRPMYRPIVMPQEQVDAFKKLAPRTDLVDHAQARKTHKKHT